MATLIDGVNEVLKRVRVFNSNDELTTLSSTSHQDGVDIAIQLWNEMIDELFNSSDTPRPNILKEDTITLAADDRDYALAADLVYLRWPLLDETNGRYIVDYPGGYLELVNSQPEPSNFTGLPLAAAIRPTDNELYLDRIPSSDEAGLVYKYRYEKDTELSLKDDTMPFNEPIFRAMVAVVAEMWKREYRKDADPSIISKSFGRAVKLLRQERPRDRWTPRRHGTPVFAGNAFDESGQSLHIRGSGL